MRVKMVNSVDDYIAGEEYDLDEETATRFLANGYVAWIDEEYTFTEEELAALREGNQGVSV